MCKIAIFSISDSLGGAEQVLFKVANYYAAKGFHVEIYFIKPKTNNRWEESINGDTKLIYLNNNLLKIIKVLRGKRYLNTFSSHLMVNSLLGFLRTFNVLKTNSLIVRESTQVFGRYSGLKLMQYKMAYWLGYRNIDLVIAQTLLMKHNLLEEVSYLKERTKIQVISNPFDFPEEDSIKEYVLVEKPYIVAAGRLISEKGFDVLIEAFNLLLSDFTDVKLVILGEGKLRNELEKKVTLLKLDEKIILKGFVNNVYPYFKGAELCVVSSIKEGFPNVLLQMMSQNTKVVSTLCAGGIEELQGITTSAIEDSIGLYEAMKTSLNNDTLMNRNLFDIELNNRSVEEFIMNIDKKIIDE